MRPKEGIDVAGLRVFRRGQGIVVHLVPPEGVPLHLSAPD
jgi:hypothetical protein